MLNWDMAERIGRQIRPPGRPLGGRQLPPSQASCLTRPPFRACPRRPRRPHREAIELYAREADARATRPTRTCPGWSTSGADGFGANRFIGRPALSSEPRPEGLPRPAPGPARHRRLHPGQPPGAPAARRPAASRPTTSRHFRADAIVRDCEAIRPGHRRRLLDRPRPELRRLLHRRLPVAGPEGLSTALITGGAALPGRPRGRRLPGAYPPHRAQGRRALRALPAGRRARPPHRRPPPDPRRGPARAATASPWRPVSRSASCSAAARAATGCTPCWRTPSSAPRTDTSCPTPSRSRRRACCPAANPLYALIHEVIYGQDARPTDWSAERVRAEFPRFDAAKALAGDERRCCSPARSIHPWMFDCDPALRPLRETAELLAARTDWTPLYDPPASPPTRSRPPRPSTTTTCTSTPPTPDHRPRSGACAPGSPTSSSTTACRPAAPRPGPAARARPRRGLRGRGRTPGRAEIRVGCQRRGLLCEA